MASIIGILLFLAGIGVLIINENVTGGGGLFAWVGFILMFIGAWVGVVGFIDMIESDIADKVAEKMSKQNKS